MMLQLQLKVEATDDADAYAAETAAAAAAAAAAAKDALQYLQGAGIRTLDSAYLFIAVCANCYIFRFSDLMLNC